MPWCCSILWLEGLYGTRNDVCLWFDWFFWWKHHLLCLHALPRSQKSHGCFILGICIRVFRRLYSSFVPSNRSTVVTMGFNLLAVVFVTSALWWWGWGALMFFKTPEPEILNEMPYLALLNQRGKVNKFGKHSKKFVDSEFSFFSSLLTFSSMMVSIQLTEWPAHLRNQFFESIQ